MERENGEGEWSGRMERENREGEWRGRIERENGEGEWRGIMEGERGRQRERGRDREAPATSSLQHRPSRAPRCTTWEGISLGWLGR